MTWRRGILAAAALLWLQGCAEITTSDVTTVTGGTLGGVFGGLAGSQFGSGTGQLVSTALGSSLGGLFGGAAGRSVGNAISSPAYTGDPYQSTVSAPPAGFGGSDPYAQDALALAAGLPLGEGVAWDNPGTGHFGTVTAIRDGRSSSGYYCREFENAAVVGGRESRRYTVACRFPDGSWRPV